MEFVKAILYHKIMDSDFTNMYGVKKPNGGGGQTYIQAAGFGREELEKMFKYANTSPTKEPWKDDKAFFRSMYTVPAQAIGTSEIADLEFAPRTGRKDYRISRQNLKYRHPAWKTTSGFPEPKKSASGSYIAEKNYPGLIDNLYIYVVCTASEDGHLRYYASFISSATLPESWPANIGLEKFFHGQHNKQGIIFFDNQLLRFRNNKDTPFIPGSAVDTEIDEEHLPDTTSPTVVDAVEFVPHDIDMSIDISAVEFDEVVPPVIVGRGKKQRRQKPIKNRNYLQGLKNNKAVGDSGEMLVMEHEKRRLTALGRPELAARVVHASKEFGDGLGYDIESFDLFEDTFEKIYIEVKATTGGISKPFEISANEVEVSSVVQDHYYIYRLFALHKDIAKVLYYVVKGSAEQNFRLAPTTYLATLK